MSKKDKKIEYTKEDLIEDLRIVSKKYRIDNPDSADFITRDYYREQSKYTEQEVNTIFGSFKNFKNYFIEEEGIKFEIEKRMLLLSKENTELKKEKEQLLKDSITTDDILNIYKDALKTEYKYPLTNKTIDINGKGKKAILVISDAHLGSIVRAEEVNGVNEFNKIICIERLNEVFRKFILICTKNNVLDCHIFFNGDLLEGGLREESTRNSDLNEIESLFYMQRYLIMKISELTKTFNNINVDFLVGNHGRILQGKPYYNEKVSMNFEYVLGLQIKMYFDLLKENKLNNKISITVPPSAFIVREINGNRMLVSHGDIFTGAGGGGFGSIPFYSILSNSAKFFGVLHQLGSNDDIHFDNVLMSHLHTTFKIPLFNGGYAFGNGCINGTDTYSLYKMKSIAKKEQLMLILQSNGLISHEMNIKFD